MKLKINEDSKNKMVLEIDGENRVISTALAGPAGEAPSAGGNRPQLSWSARVAVLTPIGAGLVALRIVALNDHHARADLL